MFVGMYVRVYVLKQTKCPNLLSSVNFMNFKGNYFFFEKKSKSIMNGKFSFRTRGFYKNYYDSKDFHSTYVKENTYY